MEALQCLDFHCAKQVLKMLYSELGEKPRNTSIPRTMQPYAVYAERTENVLPDKIATSAR